MTRDIEEADAQPEHLNFMRFVQIFNSSSLKRDGQNAQLLNFICHFVNQSISSAIAGLWRLGSFNGKMLFVNEVLTLKLPHHPLFHIYKQFLDVLIENDVSDSELER